jgi:ferredoxin, 2Fe-2S
LEVEVVVVDAEGAERLLAGAVGQSLMELAVSRAIVGIEAECGGACSCATCHVFVDAGDLPRVGPPGDVEADMLDFADVERRPNSRLACQIKLRPELAGLRVTVAGAG